MEAVPPPRPRRVRLRPLVRRFFPKPVRLLYTEMPGDAEPRVLEPQFVDKGAQDFLSSARRDEEQWPSATGEGATRPTTRRTGRSVHELQFQDPQVAEARAGDTFLTRESAGPYIISGGWWGSGAEVHREYRFVRTGEGPWLWIYYDRKRRGWFLHGKVE